MAGENLQPGLEAHVPDGSDRLDSWKEIAAYLKRDIRTVQRWEKSMALPVRRLADQQGVFAYRSDIDSWWRERETKIREEEAGHLSDPSESQATATEQRSALFQRRFKLSTILRASLAIALLSVSIALGLLWPKIQDKLRPHTGKLVLAVEPFKNLSGDADTQHVAEGMTEEIISRLGKLSPTLLGVFELPPGAANAGPGRAVRALNCDYLLEGSVRRAGQKVAVTAQLILVKDRTQVWGDSYERDVRVPEDIIPLEIDVADSLSSGVLNHLPQSGQAHSSSNRNAREAYLKGRFLWNQRTSESLTKAVTYFQQAIQLDPSYAQAYAGLADSYSLLGSAPYTALPPGEAFPKSEAAAHKALELDSSLAEAHVSLGYSELVYRWNFSKAENEFQQAIHLRPAYATAHQYYGYYLTAMGRVDEAIKEREVARELDPASPLITSALGEAYYQARQFDRTIEENQRSLELDPTYAVALLNIGRAYEQQGMHAQALSAFQKLLAVAPQDPGVLALVGHEYAVSGRRADAIGVLDQLKHIAAHRYVPALYFAVICAGLGDKTKAFEWLDKAYDEHCDYLVYLPTEPMADPLRSDPRFSRLLSRLGLKPAAALTARSQGGQ
jgi:tetratricopeptide (TPR) repeat protein